MDKWECSSEYIKKAASHGLHTLKHMHELGVPLCSSLYAYAAEKDDVPVLRFLFQAGCPWNIKTLEIIRKKHRDVIESLCRGD
jgi:hypothetical protein